MVRKRYISLAVALAGYAAGAAAVEEPSAILQQSRGQVFVGQTATMVSAQAAMPLYEGNRVVVIAGSGATLVYADGCTVALPESSLLAVGKPTQCTAGQAVARRISGFENTRVGQFLPKDNSDLMPDSPPGGILGASSGGTGTGGVGAAGAATAGATTAGTVTIAGTTIATTTLTLGVGVASIGAAAIIQSNNNDTSPQ